MVELDGEARFGGDGAVGSGFEDGEPLGHGARDERGKGEAGLHRRVSRGLGLW